MTEANWSSVSKGRGKGLLFSNTLMPIPHKSRVLLAKMKGGFVRDISNSIYCSQHLGDGGDPGIYLFLFYVKINISFLNFEFILPWGNSYV